MSSPRFLFRIAFLGCAGSLILASGCKTRNFGSQAKSDSETVDPLSTDPCRDTADRKRFRGKLPLALLAGLGKIDGFPANSSALRNKDTPWVDWQFIWGVDGKGTDNKVVEKMAASDNRFLNAISNAAEGAQKIRQQPGLLAALISLQLQRTELLRCNIFDTNGTIDKYNPGNINANTASQWDALQFSNRVDDLPEIAAKKDANGAPLQKDGKLVARDACSGAETKYRTLDGTCNDLKNPLMGAKLTRFGRNVSFDVGKG